ncbi:MAG: GNAT family protein [Planctomycetota bacterium]
MTVRLREALEDDRDFVRAIENEPAGNVMSNVRPRSDEAFRAHWDRVMRSPTVVTRMIEYSDEGVWQTTGFVTSFVTDVEVAGEASARRCIGYRLGERWWGLGIATSALRAFLADVMAERPLWALAAAGNGPSLRVLTKCGFEVVEKRWSPETERYPAGDEIVVVIR